MAVGEQSKFEYILELRAAHPHLDPNLLERHPELYRLQYRSHQLFARSDEEYNAFLNRLLHPVSSERPLESNLIEIAYYLNDATRYLDTLASLFPRRRAARLRPLPQVGECNDMRTLHGMIFDGRSVREAFEAQRKTYVAKLFFDVAHTRMVQWGEVHRDYFARLIKHDLLRHTVDERDIDIAFGLAPDGLRIDYEIGPPHSGQEVWSFQRRELNLMQDGRPIRFFIYFYSIRSKREVLPYRHVRGRRIYELRAAERWSKLSMRRDASIVSKMLRTGITNPNIIPDIIGAMFIVEDRLEVEHLKLALFDILGGPHRLRNVINTLDDPNDKEMLNRHSGSGYRVFKGEADVLYRHGDDPPYTFVVEIQLYTLESYLRTIHADHYANHQRLKRRQFLEGLAPLLFPDEIYAQ